MLKILIKKIEEKKEKHIYASDFAKFGVIGGIIFF